MRDAVDHLVLASPDLGQGVAYVRDLLGVTAVPGGRHPDFGTVNALVGLGARSYLEIIAPDPESSHEPTIFRLAEVRHPMLVTWAVRTDDLELLVARANAHGVELGAVAHGHRDRPDGDRLAWQLTDPFTDRMGGIVPFAIDWGSSPHPAESLPHTTRLTALRLTHPDADQAQTAIRSILGRSVAVEPGDAPTIEASVERPLGAAVLR